MSLKKDILINPDEIDYEILRQADLMGKYLDIMDDQKNRLDRAEEELDLHSVNLDKQIRADPEKFEVPKVTEPVVLNTIKLDEKYQALKDGILSIRHEYNSAKSAVRAIEVKKSALEHLVKLHGQSYFAGPSVPRNLSEEVAKKQTDSNTKIKIKRKGKKK